MSPLVYRICALLSQVLVRVPLGTNLGLLHLLLALLCGRFLGMRGAVFPALASLELPDADVRRSEAALCYGRWDAADLLRFKGRERRRHVRRPAPLPHRHPLRHRQRTAGAGKWRPDGCSVGESAAAPLTVLFYASFAP